MNLRWKAVAATAGMLLVGGQAIAQDKDVGLTGRVCRVTKLLDANVKNTKGEKIGEIEDLVIDKSEGEVAYCVLSFGGFLGIGEKLFAVPFAAVMRTSDDKVVTIDVTKESLEKAPSFMKDTWPDFDRTYGTTIYDYYKTKPYWSDTREGEKTGAVPLDKDALDKDRLRPRGMVRASKLIGTDVEDATGKNLGDIDDVVVDDGSGRVVYAVLSFGGFLGMGDKLFALPWSSLTPSAKDEHKVVLDVPKDRLEKAPGFEKKNWPDMADRRWGTDIHTYYGQEPWWNEHHNDR
jgi:sporulation protein YlmC with PRC-barrel domain